QAIPPAIREAPSGDLSTRSCLRQTADQVIPSITAVMAAPRTAAVATMSVTAAANHRSARSRWAARGKVQGIAGSMRIVDAPTQGPWAQKHPRHGSNSTRLKPVAAEAV